MRVILAYKNFAIHRNVSHIGLGVAAMNTAKTLTAHQMIADVWAIMSSQDLASQLKVNPDVTHVVVSAPWIPTLELQQLCLQYPRIHFAISSHSNVGFLQADSNGMKLIREALDLERMLKNFSMAANSKKMCRWIEDAYGNPCAFLPNLYFLEPRIHEKPYHLGSILRVGCFGAIRPQKNLASSVAAAIEIGFELKAKTEIYISSGRSEGGGTILNTVREMCKDLPTTTLHESGWQAWPSFRRLVSSMHLLLQPSTTESFNMVTADGIIGGVASVVGEAIDWVPSYWKANVDDIFSIAHTGRALLMNARAPRDGFESLTTYVHNGIQAWKAFLKV